MDLFGSTDGLAVFALTQREGNGSNHGNQQNGSRYLNGHDVVGVQQNTQLFGVGILLSHLPHFGRYFGCLRGSETTHENRSHFKCNQCAQSGCQWKVLPKACTQGVKVDIQHHHHKQKQHHHGT